MFLFLVYAIHLVCIQYIRPLRKHCCWRLRKDCLLGGVKQKVQGWRQHGVFQALYVSVFVVPCCTAS